MQSKSNRVISLAMSAALMLTNMIAPMKVYADDAMDTYVEYGEEDSIPAEPETQAPAIEYTITLPYYEDIVYMVDEGRIALTSAVELSYLQPFEQIALYRIMERDEVTPSLSQAQRIRRLSQEYTLTDAGIAQIMSEEKPNQKEKVHIPYVQVRKYIPENVKYEDTRDYIIQALEFYQKYRTKVPTQTINNKDAR